MKNYLSQYFLGIAAKRLSSVEIDPSTSNQHEFNGINDLKSILGTERLQFKGQFIYLGDTEDQILGENGNLTWYDARENHETRTEYRLYYKSNTVLDKAKAGDLIVIGRIGTDKMAVIIAPNLSTSEQQLLWLFGLTEVGSKFVVKDYQSSDIYLNYAGRHIISLLGFEIVEIDSNFLELLITRYGSELPKTSEFSAFARSTVKDISPVEDPDNSLLTWLEREEMLFKTFERHFVQRKLENGFGESGTDVEDFISFSLSIQNRRKSRAGFAFENQLVYIFDANNILFSRGVKTERNNKPDFIFPGMNSYQDIGFPSELLTMLGVKTSAKDRWRQVLSEANRIPRKHLITLEPSISKNQTDEMIAQNLQLVLPKPLIETYLPEQQSDLINLSDFIKYVRDKQERI